MRCREAKLWLAARRDGDLEQADAAQVQQHLKECPGCQAYEQHLHNLETKLTMQTMQTKQTIPSPRVYSSISTERIMMAVERQKRITAQLEDIRTQQQSRVARLHVVGPTVAAIIFFTIGCVPLLLLVLTVFQPDLLVRLLSLPGDGLDTLIVLAQYLQSELLLVTRDNWLMSGIALVFVILMAMWLRLMRHPQESQI
ncbi:MAG TPA: zf-HC2 domain-containing protein [Ktedonobacteraceae bacterium]|nr:zf-HC2 domain-containing protein [Ktedonobacteraceae bacterium]